MITDAFDNSEVLFGTKDFYGEQKHLCDKCMIILSHQLPDAHMYQACIQISVLKI